MSVLATVTEAEDKVVETVRGLQEPVVEYVRKGVEMAEGRLPKINYPENLPRPTEFVDSQFDFLTSLLEAQHELVKAVVGALAPLADETPRPAEASRQKATRATKATKSKAA